MKPFVKWAGGKRQILKKINEFIIESQAGNDECTYIEPFLGGGAVFFDRRPKNAIINDLNSDLMNAYRVIKSKNYRKLIELLNDYAAKYNKEKDETYYTTREWDRVPDWKKKHTTVERAARMIFLNKTCYNGLYRVNNKGEFNTPIGRYLNPTICDEQNITEIHNYLSNSENNITIMNRSYEHAIKKAKEGDIIYIDPPYDYEDDDGFTKYQMRGFTFKDFEKLKHHCDKAISKGAFVIISNNATKKVLELFRQDAHYRIFYDVNEFDSLRSINCKGSKRRTGKEVIFWGMAGNIPFPQVNDMDKVILLLRSYKKTLNNKKLAMKKIKVSNERTVAYYLSALMYFNYISQEKEFTKEAKQIKYDEDLILKDICRKLKTDIFVNQLIMYKKTKKIDDIELENQIKKLYPNLSDATVRRRASALKNWVIWASQLEQKYIDIFIKK